MPPAGVGGKRSAVSNAQLEQMQQQLQQQPGQAVVPCNFVPTAPAHDRTQPV